jgi:hypothetical protein
MASSLAFVMATYLVIFFNFFVKKETNLPAQGGDNDAN